MCPKSTILIFYFTCLCQYLFAQDEPKRYAADRIRYSKEVTYESDFVFSIGANADFSVGDWKQFSNFGLGPEMGGWFHFNNNWTISGRVGFNRWFGKQYVLAGFPGIKYENQSQWYGYTGARYNFTQTWWINPEIGYSHITFDQKKEGGFTWGLAAGADIYGAGSVIGLGIGYQQMNFDNQPHNQVGLRLRFYIGVEREKYDESEH